MEGLVARRYAKLRESARQSEDRRREAVQLTARLTDGARILEVAPGPGFFAIELARLGRFHVSGLDISQTFVEMERDCARQAGVSVDFRRGDAAEMEFPAGSFDLIVCQAAFKNFRRPREAIAEMHRVLRAGGTAVIQDLRKDASDEAIHEEVTAMGLGRVGGWVTRRILGRLRGRAYTKEEFMDLATASPFGGCDISTSRVGVEVRMTKPGTAN